VSAVGKSAFGVVVLRHALLQKPARSVIYVSSKTEDAWVFRANATGDGHDVVPFKKADLESQPELKNARTVLIADSICPPQVRAFTIMITSPKRARWKDFFAAQPCAKLAFDVFSWEEMMQMRDSCYPKMPIAELKAGYARAGGIPRMVFAYKADDSEQELKAALTKLTVPLLAYALLSAEVESDEHSHRLLHMVPQGRQPGSTLSPSELAWCRRAVSLARRCRPQSWLTTGLGRPSWLPAMWRDWCSSGWRQWRASSCTPS
jgi:hypothetical protein